MEQTTLHAHRDGLALALTLSIPTRPPRAIVQVVHGMCDYTAPYLPLLEFLTAQGFVCVMQDLRGHGKTVASPNDLGFFSPATPDAMVEDTLQVMDYAKERFPNLPVYLLGYSMGTLVVRLLLQQYDDRVQRAVLIGPPTRHTILPLGLLLVRLNTRLFGARHRSPLLQKLVFLGGQRSDIPNAWLCSVRAEVEAYNADPLRNFIFTNSGFSVLFQLLDRAFRAEAYQVKNPALRLLLLAGEQDCVIQSIKKFDQLADFLSALGYQNLSCKQYAGMRHHLLGEAVRDEVFSDIFQFFEAP